MRYWFYSKLFWVIPLNDKEGVAITNIFQKILVESGRQPNKIWADKGRGFYYRSVKSWYRKMI